MTTTRPCISAGDLFRFRNEIEAALVHTGGTHEFEDIVQAVADGVMQAWPGERSILVTEIHETPRTKELVVFLAAGDMAEIEALEHIVCEWGRSQGCQRVTAIARHGWIRTFATRRAGWKAVHTVYEKELSGGQEP